MKQFFIDETGKLSMKRICGLLCTISLCATMYQNSFTTQDVAPSSILVECTTALAFGCLGLSSVDKIWGKKNETETNKPTE
jgi:hypothetical protein